MNYPQNVQLTTTEHANMRNALAREKRTERNLQRKQNSLGPGQGFLTDVFAQTPGANAPLSNPYQLNYDNNYAPISLNRILLTYMYSTQGVAQTYIDQPIEDALRGGLEYKSDELDSDDLNKLSKFMNAKVIPVLKSAMKWRGVFGGAGIIIATEQDPAEPLDKEQINENSKFALISADRWELVMVYPNINKAKVPYSYYGQPINETRVIPLIGKEAPSFMRQRLQGWGMSEYERLMRDLQMYLKNQDVVFELLDEAKIDVMGINELNSSILSGQSDQLVRRRMLDVSMGKNYHNMLVMDKEDTYEQKQISFSGMGEILTQIRIGMAAAAKMPVTKLFGVSSAGFNSGEDDIENYNSMVESEVRGNMEPALTEIIPLVCRYLFGFEPKVEHTFKPLRVLSSEQEENVKTAKFNRISAQYSQGMYTPKEYHEKLRREGLEDMDTEVGKGSREPEPPSSAMRTDVPQEPAKPPKKGE